ncbi:MAG: mechanosensitive ion channel [Chloroflexi bacterium]|nr:mechanosensitive ion channel [Chloroflexota bacterium]
MTFWDQLSPDVHNIVLRVFAALLALIVIFLLRRVLTWVIVAPIRGQLERTRWQAGTMAFDIITVGVRFFIIALGLFIGAQILGISDVFIERLVRTFVIFGVAAALFRAVAVIALSRRQLQSFTGIVIEDELLPFIRTALRLVIIALALVIIIQEWGYDVSGLVAGLGLGGLAFSLAAQDTISNLFGFTAVVGDRPFVEGEYIKIPEAEGSVEHVGLRSTRIRRLDQALVTVPNSKMASAAVINWSRLSKRHYTNRLGIDYKTRSSQLRVILPQIREMLHARATVETESIQVFFNKFGQNALEIDIICNIKLPDYLQFCAEREAINLAVMEIIEHAGMTIAEPHIAIDGLSEYPLLSPADPQAAPPAPKSD